MKASVDYKCPECSQDDKVRKISSIVMGGTSSGSYSGPTVVGTSSLSNDQRSVGVGYSTVSGTSQTALSSLLSPPRKPEIRSYPFLLSCLGYFILPMSGCGALVMAIILSLGMFAGAISGDFSIGQTLSATSVPSLLFFGPIILFSFGISFLIIRGKKQRRANEEIRVAKALEFYDVLIKIWNELYYCERNDLVFNPIDGSSSHANQFISYLITEGISRHPDVSPETLKNW